MDTEVHPPLLDATFAEFIQQRVSINVASCSAARVPSLARAFGCRVSRNRSQVTVFLSVQRAEPLLKDLRAGSAVAVVFTRPTTHQTIQLKGRDAAIVPLADGDRALMRAYGAGFVEEIRAIGYRDPFASAMMMAVAEEAVGVRFTPAAAFDQTPGPKAGQRLDGGT
jgi:hypothetical protein